MLPDATAPLVTALVALGMALAFYRADPDAPTSRALSLALAGAGVSFAFNMYVVRPLGAGTGHVPGWIGLLSISETIAFVAIYEWLLRVRRTVPAGKLRTRFGDVILRIAQALAIVYGALAVALPEKHTREFIGALVAPDALYSFDFYLFSIPLEVSIALAIVSLLLILNRRPDPAERVRLVGLAIGLPFTAVGLVLPQNIAAVLGAVGLLVFLVGAVQYHVMQGQRGVFLSRFLAPQVATLVRSRGLRSVMQDTQLEITALCCDLRGFTAFVERSSSAEVIALLREYYESVNEAVTRYEGTIKDYAGDGMLILVGAPLPLPDRPARALALAQDIRERVSAVLGRRASGIGVAIGVASGRATVGVVGGAGRLEYAAVGPVVNLAARLCEHAEGGEILLDEATAAAVPDGGFVTRSPLQFKGIGPAVAHFALASAPG